MQKKTITSEDYARRINMVIEYIGRNLDKAINLNELSEISNFSIYHFHRIFRAIVGESVGAFVVRMRVETAARLLRYTSLPVQDIAYSVGYNMPSSLTKVFRQFYGITPTDYRNNKNYIIMKPLLISKIVKIDEPRIIELEPSKAIYVRLMGNYQSLDYCGAYSKLWDFVKENNLYTPGIEYINISYDDPKVTETDKLRTDVCLIIHKPAVPKGDIGVRDVAGGKFAVFTYVGSYSNLFSVFNTIYGTWLPQSGYQLRMEQGYEKYMNHPDETPEDELITEIYVPIE